MSDVFISYSRRDKLFVQHLFDRLEQHGHETWVDWDDIEYAEDWWRKICAGIESADNFIFIMTPDSIRSKICFDEIEFAVGCNKRIIPVLRREIDDEADQQRMHPALRSHNWLPLRDDAITDDSLQVLLGTIARDPEHVQAHTRFLMRAREWERAERNASLLLRGDDLKQAENWLAAGVNREPVPTPLQAEYINASRIAQRSRQRSLFIGVALALVISIGLAILSFGLFRQSEERRVESDQRGTAVAQQAATATLALGAAEINLRQAWDAQSRLLADFSRQELASGHTQTALLLALESLGHVVEGVVNQENTAALRNVLASPAEVLHLVHDDAVLGARWNADLSRILTYSLDGTARLWDTHSGSALWTVRHDAAILSATWNAGQSQILTASSDGTARIWDADSGENLRTLQHEGAVWAGIWFDDEHRILTLENEVIQDASSANPGQYAGRVHIWAADDGRELLHLDHPNLVRSARISSDGTHILTSCDDGFARIWDAESGQMLLALPHDSAVFLAVFNPDETRILTIARELSQTVEVRAGSSINVWNAETGEELLDLPYPGIAASLPIWNRDGTRILTTSSDPDGQWGLVQVWDAESGDELLALRQVANSGDLGAPEPQAVWNADETRILSWAGSTIRVWDAESGDVLRTLRHEAVVRGAIWSKDEARVMAWDNDGVIQVWDVGNQDMLMTLRHDGTVGGARWNDDESAILSWSDDGTARLWNASDPTRLLEINTDSPFGGAVWNPDGTEIAFWSGPDAAVWDPEAGERLYPIDHAGETVHGMSWNRAGSQILSWGRDGTARLWDATDGREILSLRHNEVVLEAQWSPDETRLLTRTLDGWLHVWDLVRATKLFPAVKVLSSGAGGALWSPDNRHILSWSSDEGTLRLWDADSGTEVQSIPSEPGFIGAAWNPAGTRILYWNNGDSAHIWDVAAGAEELTLLQVTRRADLENFNNAISGGLWSADGRRVLTWTTYGDIRIWDAEDGTELIAVDDCGDQVQWSADETRLLCGRNLSANDGIRVWDIAQGEVVLEYPLEVTGQIDSVAWNAEEGRILAWTILDASAYVWIADIQELVAIGQARSYRELTSEERAQFFLPPVSSSGADQAAQLGPP
ncbi:MAG: TIR domain-containing protein [Anaerolineae bacterium]|nr:TIR domain-containing protein [Anaerolineae bacterium]